MYFIYLRGAEMFCFLPILYTLAPKRDKINRDADKTYIFHRGEQTFFIFEATKFMTKRDKI